MQVIFSINDVEILLSTIDLEIIFSISYVEKILNINDEYLSLNIFTYLFVFVGKEKILLPQNPKIYVNKNTSEIECMFHPIQSKIRIIDYSLRWIVNGEFRKFLFVNSTVMSKAIMLDKEISYNLDIGDKVK